MAYSNLKSNFFKTSSATDLHYLRADSRSGRLVVCLHGLGGSTNTFSRTLVPRFPSHYDVVLVDFQGFGKTPLKSRTSPLSIHDHVADIHDLITYLQESKTDTENRPKVILIGHSLGCIVSLQYAAKYPSDVAGLAMFGAGRSAAHIPVVRQKMLDTAAATREHGIEYIAQKAIANNFPSPEQRNTPPVNMETMRQEVASSDQEGYARTCEMIVDLTHVDPDYSKITCPSIFIAGDLDMISPVSRSEDLSKLVGGPSEVVIVQSGHQLIIDDLEGSLSAVLKLFERI